MSRRPETAMAQTVVLFLVNVLGVLVSLTVGTVLVVLGHDPMPAALAAVAFGWALFSALFSDWSHA